MTYQEMEEEIARLNKRIEYLENEKVLSAQEYGKLSNTINERIFYFEDKYINRSKNLEMNY